MSKQVIILHQDVHTFKQQGFPLGAFRNCNHPDYPMHRHDFDELVIVFKGTGVNSVAGIKYPIRTGDVFFIPKGLAHAYSHMKNMHCYNICFDMKKLNFKHWAAQSLPGFHALFTVEPSYRAKYAFKTRLHLNQKQLIQIYGLAETLDQTLIEKQPGFRLISLARFLEIVAKLSDFYEKTPHKDSHKVLQIAKAISYIETHFSEEISLDKLASITHMSQRNFNRVFIRATGNTPSAHLLQVRVMEAEHMLSHSDKSITEIALDCGFAESNYFARAFRKITGQSPSSFRKTAFANNR